MPQKARAPSRKQKGEKRKSKGTNPSADAMTYRGPLRLPGSRLQMSLTTVMLGYNASLTSNGSGVVSQVWGLNVSLFDLYTSFTTLYDEFRLLSATLLFVPNASGATVSSVAYAPLAIVLDRDSTTALTGYPNAVDYDSFKVRPINDTLRAASYRMAAQPDAAFITSSTTSVAWFKMYATGLTASTTYGQVFVESLWQGRARA
jgi:hypothetical protein